MALHSAPYYPRGDVQFPIMQVSSLLAKAFGWPRMPPDLLMGQKDHLLIGVDNPNHGFTKVHNFNRVESIKSSLASKITDDRILKVNGEVIGVKKIAKNEILCRFRTLEGYQDVVCEQLIGSVGVGPEREVEMPIQRRASGSARPFEERTTGVKSLTGVTPMIFGSMVVLFGDGPTVMWNAEAYRSAGNSVYVIGPPSLKAFAAANPGGRNSKIYESLLEEDRLWCGAPEGLVQRENIKYLDDPTEPGMLLYLKDMRSVLSGRQIKSFVVPTSQIVSSIGSIPRTLDIFDPSICNDFRPIVMTGLVEKDYAVALTNTDGDIIVLGSGATDASADFGARSLFAAAGDRIWQPDKGVLATRHSAQMVQWCTEAHAMGSDMGDIGSSVKYFSRSIEVDAFTANSLQLTQFFIDYGVPHSDIPELVGAVIKHREKKAKNNEGFSNYDLIKFARHGE
jgi:hypothetical protein